MIFLTPAVLFKVRAAVSDFQASVIAVAGFLHDLVVVVVVVVLVPLGN
jgi:hypothetical protein